jgi:hydrogenase nickel incorporation protein HypB
MPDITLIKIKESILGDNIEAAGIIRRRLAGEKVFMLNLMSSPGAGKTSLLCAALPYLQAKYRTVVIEGDIDTVIDAEKIIQCGGQAIQVQTGGDCHLDSAMIQTALDKLDLGSLDIILVENIGNLVCPAEFDTGANVNVAILSVPEGDDKVLKYPLMFAVCQALIISKMDALGLFDFNLELLQNRLAIINPAMQIFPLSAKTGDGVAAWCDWLSGQIEAFRARPVT